MPNYGIPLETTTDELRAFRITVGDTNYETVAAPPGHPEWTADYTLFSDLEAEGFIAQGEDNTLRAAGWAYMALAAQAALSAKSWKDYDLASDTTKRPDQLRLTAQWFFEQADIADLEDGFFIGSTGERCDTIWPPELAPWDLSQFHCSRCGLLRCICGV